MNTTQPTEKPRPTLFRRVYGAFVAFGDWLAYLGNPPPVPKPGEFWTDEPPPINPFSEFKEGAQVEDVKDGWVKYARCYKSFFPLPPRQLEYPEVCRVSNFVCRFHPPGGVRPPPVGTGPN